MSPRTPAGADHLDLHDRLEERRLHLLDGVAERLAPRRAETVLVGVDRVVRAVDERHLEVDERVAGDGAVRRGLDDALLDGRAELLRDGAAEDLVLEDEAAAARQRLEDDLAVAELPAPAGLLLVAALHLGARRDGLLVGDLRRVERHLDVVAVLQLLDDGLDVELARAGEDELLRLRVAREVERGVFFENLVERDAESSPRPAATSARWRRRWRPPGIRRRRRRSGAALSASVSPVCVSLSLTHGDDVARAGLVDLVELLALHRVERAEALGRAARRVLDGGVRLDACR